MPTFMLMIHGDREAWEHMPTEEQSRIAAGHRAFVAAAGEAILGGGELDDASTATFLRSPHGQQSGTPGGPFPQARQVVGGYYLVDVPGLEEAVRLATLLPEVRAAYDAGVEIRRVLDDD